ncbi:ACP S-malonyltransferase [Paenibacillus oleatilyticus]|uniref:[acyl-carrier-protein] S-malonyltransferase n=1 Tax=Paenibacillus oleatilyticus TaxID=2594886 RepID=A0ABV4VA46_9BACL
MNKIALIFPGQGTQYAGMGKKLFEQETCARAVYEEIDEALGFSLSGICFNGDETQLMDTQYAQPAIFAYSVAQFRVMEERWNIRPYYGAGHSLGEYSALCCSGALSIEDAVRTVYHRGKLMKEAAQTDGAMAGIIGLDLTSVEEICSDISTDTSLVVVAAINSHQHFTISGHRSAVNEATQRIQKRGGGVIPIRVSGAFHSPLMITAAVELREVLVKKRFARMRWPVLSNVTGLPHTIADLVQRLVEQMTEPVQWQACMNYLEEKGVRRAVELGPGDVLKKLVGPLVSIRILSHDSDFAMLEEELTPEENRLGLIGGAMAVAVSLKNSNWDSEQYTAGVTEPYQRIKSLYTDLEKNKQYPTIAHMLEALDMLGSVIRTKKVDLQEGRKRMEDLLWETGTHRLLQDVDLPL